MEGASFIAAPSCGLYLLQYGAEVIRFDDLRKSLDRNRWPVAPNGASLYWEGLNKGKKSVALDLSRPEGREIAAELITAPGDDAGLFVTNYPAEGFLSHAKLAARRADLITLRVMGWPDGRQAVDYTVNSAFGVPLMTGPAFLGEEPVNHVLPAWDLLAGGYGAFSLLAAENHRRRTGAGGEIRLPLSDVALTALGNLGQIAEVTMEGRDRDRLGNDLYGAFGRDFATRDGKRLMVVAITSRQWTGLVAALNLEAEMEALERELDVDFVASEDERFLKRDVLFSLVSRAIADLDRTTLAQRFDANGVCWGPYQTLEAALRQELPARADGLFTATAHPSGMTYPTPGAAATLPGRQRGAAPSAPIFGGHTEEVLTEVLGYSSGRIATLVDDGVIDRPKA